MKKVLIVLFALLTMQVVKSDEVNVVPNENEMEAVDAINSTYVIDGPTSYQLTGSSGVGSAYTLTPTPPAGASVEWGIKGGGRAYVSKTGYGCTINIYDVGSYRLYCKITVGSVVEEPAVYISVYK